MKAIPPLPGEAQHPRAQVYAGDLVTASTQGPRLSAEAASNIQHARRARQSAQSLGEFGLGFVVSKAEQRGIDPREGFVPKGPPRGIGGCRVHAAAVCSTLNEVGMLLESRLGTGQLLLIDCENAGGVDKNALGADAHPDQIFDNAVQIIQSAAETLGAGLSLSGQPAPVVMEVEFGVRVDANATVSLARSPDQAHFRVRLRWDA
jgi:hypothetical protein